MAKGTGEHKSPPGAINPKSDVDVGLGSGETLERAAKLLASVETGHLTSDALKWAIRARAVATAFLSLSKAKDKKKVIGGSKQTATVDQDHLTGDAGKQVLAMREDPDEEEPELGRSNPVGGPGSEATPEPDFKIPE